MIHFEELWEKCEIFHKENQLDASLHEIMEALSYKLSLYKSLDAKIEVPEEERSNAKSRLFGEILLTLTQLSLAENINVFDALGIALQYKSIGVYSQKYP